MDQLKIGRFIAERRKNKGFTQAALADKLGITDRAVSKWERGKSMPDVSVMIELCKTLGITVNELLIGEAIDMKDYNEKNEELLLEMAKQKEEADKRLLRFEVIMGFICVMILLGLGVFASYVKLPEWQRVVLILIGVAPILVASPVMIRIEQTAGYYCCKECGHKYVPDFKSVFYAAHMGRTRKMRCPRCGKKSWQKKVISKD